MELVCLLFLGLIVGFVGAFLGVGGGFIVVPALVLLYGLDAHHAVGTSLATVFFTGLFSAIAYFRQKRVDWKVGLLLEIFTVPGAILGAYTTTLASSEQLVALFATFLFFVSYKMWTKKEGAVVASKVPRNNALRRTIVDSSGRRWTYEVNVLLACSLAFLAGFCSGFFGIGGGVLKVPVLIYSGIPTHIAIATSAFMISITASSGATSHMLLGNVELGYLPWLVPGILAGTQIGARVAKKTKPRALRKAFSVALVLIAAMMIAKSLGFL